MSQRKAPSWWVEVQERMGETIRRPLDRSTNVLRANLQKYPAYEDTLATESKTAEERLAIYNCQYWFRLFSVMQCEFPLSARLVGFWHFNALAERFLLKRPPRHPDIGAVADGFLEWVQAIEEDPIQGIASRDIWGEAVELDEVWRSLFRAPEQEVYRPSTKEATRLMYGWLLPADGWRLYKEHWPLVELRQSLLASPPEHERAILPPPLLRSPQNWLLFRRIEGTLRLPISRLHARLLELLCVDQVGQALATLESECSPEERAALPQQVQHWLTHSVENGFWKGLRFARRSELE